MIGAVVLDLDDTVFDHRASARRGVSWLIEELHGKADERVLEAWERSAGELSVLRLAGELDRQGYRRERVRILLRELGRSREAEVVPDDLADRLYARFVDLYESSWVAFDDAVPLLRELGNRHVPAAILTNGPEERQQRKADVLGLRPWVTGVWTSERLGLRKPDPDCYLAVCESLGVTPEGVLHIGDDLGNDLIGARDAGLRALHLDRRNEEPDAPWRISGLREVLGHL
ncbi:HAD family hydrolase [Brachybacterium sp. NBEC-018]|uniref:HAD family hydrolase n=1 Tax=Brachybacterium sp. NBEC-018 TaxID=2996004 RepID=UPI0021750091|nr:HAD family hydrolase [Brachybacterium sp. NBEC-018]UVY84971.1 HAD family hydrolase [Brachybacterium sp. NBEC-018]